MFNAGPLRRAAFVLVLPTGMLLSGGCEKQESASPQPAPPAASPATRPAGETPAAGTLGADSGLTGLTDEARRASQTQPAMPRDPLPGVTTPAPAIPSLTPDASATAPASPAAGEKTAEAQKLLDQAMQYVKENKYDLAEKALSQLDGMKSSLPAEWAPRIESARKALTAAKAGGGVKLPEGLPGLPK